MTNHSMPGSTTDLLQAPWLRQSYLVGHPAERVNHYQEALAIYQHVLELDPGHILAHLLQAWALVSLEREEEAKAAFTSALHLAERELHQHPESVRAWIYKGDALWKLAEENDGREAEALHAYEQVLRLDPENAEAYLNRGWLLFVLDRLEEALHDFEQALRLKPDDPELYGRKGCVLWNLWRYEEALQAYEQEITLDPTSPGAYHGKGSALVYLVGREAEAEQAFAFYQQLMGVNEHPTE